MEIEASWEWEVLHMKSRQAWSSARAPGVASTHCLELLRTEEFGFWTRQQDSPRAFGQPEPPKV